MEVTLLRADEDMKVILAELMEHADSVVKFDCAGPTANFVQVGWFVFPPRSLSPAVGVERAA